MKIDKTDYKYVGVDADKDFSPDHNKKVIAEVMRKNEVLFARHERDRKEKTKERTSAIASYVKNTKDNTTPEEYFGKRYLTQLRGQQIVERLRNEAQEKQSKA
jgi:hypothetical protein